MTALLRIAAVLALAALPALGGCASAPREPFTPEEQAEAGVPGIPDARLWLDDPTAIRRLLADTAARAPASRTAGVVSVLSISGGGDNGAFGAGLLVGWSERGTRPEFAAVTGVSVGALIAPFAFLGSRYDPALRRMFTEGTAERTLALDGLVSLLRLRMREVSPLTELVGRYVDRALLEAVATEHRRGRLLLVVTTNLDAQRTTAWNMGAIASSGDAGAIELFRDVLVASASIPAVFPPAFIRVTSGGRRFSEMHVDGGVTTNVLVVPEALLLGLVSPGDARTRPQLFVIVNNKLVPEFGVVPDRTIQVVGRAVSTAVKASTRSTLISAYAFARRQRWGFNLAAIDPGFSSSTGTGFDTAAMRRLYDHGYAKGRSGQIWEMSLPSAPDRAWMRRRNGN